MAPVPTTEDYYMILEVEQTATLEQITRSYKRLALKLHPDRNTRHDATEAFQLLAEAYEILKDESKRRDYDIKYPSLTRNGPSRTTQMPYRPSATTPQSEELGEAAQIAALQKSKQDRGTRWRTKQNAFDSAIFELQRDIRRLEQEIKTLNSIAAAVAAEKAQKNSWGTWLLSPIYKRAEDSEEEKAHKERYMQERRIEKDMKERRLVIKTTELKEQENQLKKARGDIDAADLVDDRKIGAILTRIWARESSERRERERVEAEKLAKIWKQRQEQQAQREREEAEKLAKIWKQRQEQQAQREREASEALRKRQAEIELAELKRREEQAKKRQTTREICSHDGWWPKVQGRTVCPECHDIWSYLLQCPGCKMKACPKCQYTIRPRRNRTAPRNRNRTAPRHRQTPSEDDYYDD